MTYDVVIIGAGPAGLTAAIYAKRACLDVLLLQDKYSIGSQICSTYEVCNFPGLNGIPGMDLYNKMLNHAKDIGVNIISEKVIEIRNHDSNIKKVITKNNIYDTKTIVLSTGAIPKEAGFKGEMEHVGMGVSYCATCDGAFYKNKVVAVVGGGDTAVEDAIFLSRVAKQVYLFVRRNELRATKILQQEIEKLSNVSILYEAVIDEVRGDGKVSSIMVKSINSSILSEIEIDGVFIAIGVNPNTNLLEGKVNLDNGYVVANEDCESSVKGIYAIGDVRKKKLRQVITACADGANVVTSIGEYLINTSGM